MVSLSEKAKDINRYIEILLYGYIVVASVRLIFGDFNNFFNDIMTILSAFLSILQGNYFWTSILILFLILNVFYEMTNLLLIIQNWLLGLLSFNVSINQIYFFMVISSLIINICLIYFSFLAYRELKALFFEQHSITALNPYRSIPDSQLDETSNDTVTVKLFK